MNEYDLPIWYVRVFEIICDYQQASEREAENGFINVFVGYLKALVDTGTITEKQSCNIFYLLMVAR